MVDCSDISRSHGDTLLMNSRDRLARAEFTNQVIAELEARLNEHQALRKLRNERIRYAGVANPDFVNTIELNVKPPHQPAGSDTDQKKPKRRLPRADLPELIPVAEPEWFAASALAAAASGDGE